MITQSQLTDYRSQDSSRLGRGRKAVLVQTMILSCGVELTSLRNGTEAKRKPCEMDICPFCGNVPHPPHSLLQEHTSYAVAFQDPPSSALPGAVSAPAHQYFRAHFYSLKPFAHVMGPSQLTTQSLNPNLDSHSKSLTCQKFTQNILFIFITS